MAHPLDSAAGLLSRLPDHTGKHRRGEGGRPADGSPAAREIAALTEQQAPYLRDLISTANLRLTVAEELLSSVGHLQPQPHVFFSTYPMVRSAADLAGRVSWLLDDDADVTGPRRAGRALGDRLSSIDEQKQLPIPRLKREGAERRKKVLRAAASVGLTPTKPPGNTQAVADAWGDSDEDLGEEDRDLGRLTYKLLAATTHGTLYALTRHLNPLRGRDGQRVPGDLPGQVTAQFQVSVELEADAVMMAMVPYMRAARLWMWWMGREPEDWAGYMMYASGAFRRFMTGRNARAD